MYISGIETKYSRGVYTFSPVWLRDHPLHVSYQMDVLFFSNLRKRGPTKIYWPRKKQMSWIFLKSIEPWKISSFADESTSKACSSFILYLSRCSFEKFTLISFAKNGFAWKRLCLSNRWPSNTYIWCRVSFISSSFGARDRSLNIRIQMHLWNYIWIMNYEIMNVCNYGPSINTRFPERFEAECMLINTHEHVKGNQFYAIFFFHFM